MSSGPTSANKPESNRTHLITSSARWLSFFESIAKILSYVAVPVILGISSYTIQDALSQRQVSKEYVALAISILSSTDKEQDPKLREWAVELLNKFSPIKFDQTTVKKLTSGEINISYDIPQIDFTVDPQSIKEGESTTLEWSSRNATQCARSGSWSGPTASSGKQVISGITSNSTFTLTCSGPGGSVSRLLTVAVFAELPMLTLRATPTTIREGDDLTLEWKTTGVTSCVASGSWSGSKPVSGKQTLKNFGNQNSIFTLTCSGKGGSASQSASVVSIQRN